MRLLPRKAWPAGVTSLGPALLFARPQGTVSKPSVAASRTSPRRIGRANSVASTRCPPGRACRRARRWWYPAVRCSLNRMPGLAFRNSLASAALRCSSGSRRSRSPADRMHRRRLRGHGRAPSGGRSRSRRCRRRRRIPRKQRGLASSSRLAPTGALASRVQSTRGSLNDGAAAGNVPAGHGPGGRGIRGDRRNRGRVVR